MPISNEDKRRISLAVKTAEARTSGEIVCVLAQSASDYGYVPLIWAALIALIAPWPLIAVTLWPVQWIYTIQLAVFLLLAILLSFPALRMALVPRRIKRLRANRAALEQFMLRGVSRTRERTGILIFVALGERFARIVADTGIADRVPQTTWQDAVDVLVTECKNDHIAAGFVAAIGKCGVVLAEHFPPRARNDDELPDRLYVI